MPSSIFTNRRLTPFCSIISLPSQIPLSQLSLSEDDSVTTLIFATSSISHSLYQTKIAFRKSFSKQWFCESFSLTAIPVFQRTCFAPRERNRTAHIARSFLTEPAPWLKSSAPALFAGRDPYPALSGECRSFPAVILTKRTQKYGLSPPGATVHSSFHSLISPHQNNAATTARAATSMM